MRRLGQLPLDGKRVFLRADFNAPLSHHKVADAARIEAAIPTLRYLLDHAARLVIASHLGRPKLDKSLGPLSYQPQPEFSLKPIREALQERLGVEVILMEASVVEAGQRALETLPAGKILLLENTRFYPGETANDPALAKIFAEMGEVYVSDAFGCLHRAHASTAGIANHVQEGGTGFLVERELEYLSRAVATPEHPFVLVLGGAKVSDKIKVFEHLLDKVDRILVGGAMAYTLLKANGSLVGDSRVEEDNLDVARRILKAGGEKIVLPLDHIAAEVFKMDAQPMEISGPDIPDGLIGMDIGPRTVKLYDTYLQQARLAVWNGPMGVFEWPVFQWGSFCIAESMALTEATTIVGGGDSAAAVKASGFQSKMSHISTGGGAALEFLEGARLPGLVALERFE